MLGRSTLGAPPTALQCDAQSPTNRPISIRGCAGSDMVSGSGGGG